MGRVQGWGSTKEVMRVCLVWEGQEGQMGKNRAGLGSREQLGTAAGWGACWELAGKGLDNGNEQGTGSHLPGLGTGRVCSGWWEV